MISQEQDSIRFKDSPRSKIQLDLQETHTLRIVVKVRINLDAARKIWKNARNFYVKFSNSNSGLHSPQLKPYVRQGYHYVNYAYV